MPIVEANPLPWLNPSLHCERARDPPQGPTSERLLDGSLFYCSVSAFFYLQTAAGVLAKVRDVADSWHSFATPSHHHATPSRHHTILSFVLMMYPGIPYNSLDRAQSTLYPLYTPYIAYVLYDECMMYMMSLQAGLLNLLPL